MFTMTSLVRYAVGEIIDDQYEVRAFLGSGTNGDVYRVLDMHLNVELALKLLDPSSGVGDWKEAQALQALRSDYILEVRNAAVIPGVDVRYITTAIAEGGDCGAATPTRGLSVRQALQWCQQATNGLARVHDERLVHRDIKPANIFLNADGQALLGDFGHAALMDDANSAAPFGTPTTAAPEVWSGEQCTVVSDIYSMGATAFYLLTGQWPRPGRDSAAVKANAIAGTGPRLADIAPHLPLRVVRTVERAMAMNPSDRHQRADDLGAEFGVCGRELGRPWQHNEEHPGHHMCLTGDKHEGRSAIQVCVVPDGRRFSVAAAKPPSGRPISPPRTRPETPAERRVSGPRDDPNALICPTSSA